MSQLRGPIWEGPVETSNGTSSVTLRKALILLLEKSLAFSLLGLQLLSQQQLAHKWPAMMGEQKWEKHIIQSLAQTEERGGRGKEGSNVLGHFIQGSNNYSKKKKKKNEPESPSAKKKKKIL